MELSETLLACVAMTRNNFLYLDMSALSGYVWHHPNTNLSSLLYLNAKAHIYIHISLSARPPELGRRLGARGRGKEWFNLASLDLTWFPLGSHGLT